MMGGRFGGLCEGTPAILVAAGSLKAVADVTQLSPFFLINGFSRLCGNY